MRPPNPVSSSGRATSCQLRFSAPTHLLPPRERTSLGSGLGAPLPSSPLPFLPAPSQFLFLQWILHKLKSNKYASWSSPSSGRRPVDYVVMSLPRDHTGGVHGLPHHPRPFLLRTNFTSDDDDSGSGRRKAEGVKSAKMSVGNSKPGWEGGVESRTQEQAAPAPPSRQLGRGWGGTEDRQGRATNTPPHTYHLHYYPL